MKLAVKVMKALFPRREAERMEVRNCITRGSAEAEDLLRSIESTFNGHLKEVSWEKFSQSSPSVPYLCLPKK